MKRIKAINIIHKTLQPWESSKLDKNCAKQILAALEELGIICPPERKIDEFKYIDDEGKAQVLDIFGNDWED